MLGAEWSLLSEAQMMLMAACSMRSSWLDFLSDERMWVDLKSMVWPVVWAWCATAEVYCKSVYVNDLELLVNLWCSESLKWSGRHVYPQYVALQSLHGIW